MSKYLLLGLVIFLVAIAVNLWALGIVIYCDFSLMGLGGKNPSNSIRAAMWFVSSTVLLPMEWLGGYRVGNFLVMSLIESILFYCFTVVAFLFASNLKRTSRSSDMTI